MIGIVDYGLGNVKAFANILKSLDVPFVIAKTPDEIRGVSKIILPGVGAFDQAMSRLKSSGMQDALNELVLGKGLPVIGICVGMQILMNSSEEGTGAGLGWIDGDVVRFSNAAQAPRLRIPHMGWNAVAPADPTSGLFRDFAPDAQFYFLHSYYVRCASPEHVLARTQYGVDFASAVSRGNIFGVQFHPEKSHSYGIQLLRNFSEL